LNAFPFSPLSGASSDALASLFLAVIVSPAIPEAAATSSRRSPSPQEVINITDHVFEPAALVRTSSVTSPPTQPTRASPSATTSTASPEKLLVGEQSSSDLSRP
jgi:hypothetical protein